VPAIMPPMIECLLLLVPPLRAAVRDRTDLVAETLSGGNTWAAPYAARS
jgi:hypothetical protein